ncbi:uncharacterized protein LOC132951685 [Metopolophium dirhodum]|uniref:uncharacterized protein LOC132951685 n=1 Tax=Metopolophium dirhodum TaxID=44670 RepID=UPI00298FACB7|nr:uncharacterized protein LOC132951685 [Metopolophium dirhodum]
MGKRKLKINNSQAKHDMEGYLNSGQSTFLLKNDDTLIDKEVNVSKTSIENSSKLNESEKVVTDDLHLLNNVETEVDILTSESNQSSKTKYGLRSKKSCVLKQSSYSENFNIDQLNDIHNSDISQPSNSHTTLNQKDILNNEVKESTKILKKGYGFNGLVETSKIKQISNKRSWDKTTNCIYCEKNVTNFTRHIIRNHSMKFEVARYLSLPKGSNERAELAENLLMQCWRGRSYLSNQSDVQMSFLKQFLMPQTIYHVNTAMLGRNRAQSNAQNLLRAFSNTDQDLVTKVFPRMAVDNISFVAKSDEFIKAFGSRYLKNHREKHLVHVVTQKMRTLARLLIQMQLEYPSIKTLQECVVPKHFDLIVKCTKTVAGYDISKDLYGAPSVVLTIGNMLKQCCDIAEFTLLKHCNNLKLDEAQSSTQNVIINMRPIIEKQWSYEVLTNTSKEILQKKWNKPAFLPLTSDIQLFRNHLIHVQNVSTQELKNNPNNQKSFKNLESIVAQLILLNRRRSGEVLRLFINTYLTAPT